ncbi:MAG TPA: thioesterase family protein [Mycobacteriales bacterium]|jgi:acyl-CoA thioester hydrolase|nr:thioesterase family protein [Mycobacteriales bacterium]
MAFVHPLRVQFFEVDLQGVVFNMWYLAWFDNAMTAYLAELGFPYDAMKDLGWDVQLVHTEVDWRGGATFGDELGVEVTTDRIGATSFTLAFRVVRGEEELVTAKTVYVVVGVDDYRKRAVPDDLRKALDPSG